MQNTRNEARDAALLKAMVEVKTTVAVAIIPQDQSGQYFCVEIVCILDVPPTSRIQVIHAQKFVPSGILANKQWELAKITTRHRPHFFAEGPTMAEDPTILRRCWTDVSPWAGGAKVRVGYNPSNTT